MTPVWRGQYGGAQSLGKPTDSPDRLLKGHFRAGEYSQPKFSPQNRRSPGTAKQTGRRRPTGHRAALPGRVCRAGARCSSARASTSVSPRWFAFRNSARRSRRGHSRPHGGAAATHTVASVRGFDGERLTGAGNGWKPNNAVPIPAKPSGAAPPWLQGSEGRRLARAQVVHCDVQCQVRQRRQAPHRHHVLQVHTPTLKPKNLPTPPRKLSADRDRLASTGDPSMTGWQVGQGR